MVVDWTAFSPRLVRLWLRAPGSACTIRAHVCGVITLALELGCGVLLLQLIEELGVICGERTPATIKVTQ